MQGRRHQLARPPPAPPPTSGRATRPGGRAQPPARERVGAPPGRPALVASAHTRNSRLAAGSSGPRTRCQAAAAAAAAGRRNSAPPNSLVRIVLRSWCARANKRRRLQQRRNSRARAPTIELHKLRAGRKSADATGRRSRRPVPRAARVARQREGRPGGAPPAYHPTQHWARALVRARRCLPLARVRAPWPARTRLPASGWPTRLRAAVVEFRKRGGPRAHTHDSERAGRQLECTRLARAIAVESNRIESNDERES